MLVRRRNTNKAVVRMENQNGLSVKAAAHESKWEIRCGSTKPLFSSWSKEATLTWQNTSICVQGWSVQERAFGIYQLVPFWLWEETSWVMVGLIMTSLIALSAKWAGILRKWIDICVCIHCYCRRPLFTSLQCCKAKGCSEVCLGSSLLMLKCFT